jgi:hypothetical protein
VSIYPTALDGCSASKQLLPRLLAISQAENRSSFPDLAKLHISSVDDSGFHTGFLSFSRVSIIIMTVLNPLTRFPLGAPEV